MTPSADDIATRHRQPTRGIGVLLVNLGTPDAATATAIRRYLRQFLSDRRVVEVPRLLWWLLLNLVILPFRPRKLVEAYHAVWTPEGSPLLAVSRAQQSALQARLGADVRVELAMTYGNPGIAEALARLQAAGVDRLLLLPLYPQYSATTTAAALDSLFRLQMADRCPPALRTIRDYHDDPGYIAALAASVRKHWQLHGRGDHLLMSFHGIPQRNLLRGDPYHCHCHKTARLLAEALELPREGWSLSFQSRLGRMPWLQPYTDRRLVDLAAAGTRTLDVICPGFSADCLETLEEVTIRYNAQFQESGGAALRYIPALNAEPEHIEALAALVQCHLKGWARPPETAETQDQRAQRALAALPDANLGRTR